MLGWVKGLSATGKIVASLVSMGMIGAVASANPAPQTTTPPKTQPPQTQPVEKKPAITKKTVSETEPIAFAKTTVDDGNLEAGKTQIKTAGVNGVKTFTYELTLEEGKEKGKKLVKEEITTAPVTEVTSIGTKAAYVAPKPNCDPNYSPCVPNVSYDLDCSDIGISVTVIGSDPHGFDRDGDGYGCESY